jgi:hypothetical protein
VSLRYAHYQHSQKARRGRLVAHHVGNKKSFADIPVRAKMQTEFGVMRMNPVVTVTMGDPAGVGPEVTVKALVQEAVERVLCQSQHRVTQSNRDYKTTPIRQYSNRFTQPAALAAAITASCQLGTVNAICRPRLRRCVMHIRCCSK